MRVGIGVGVVLSALAFGVCRSDPGSESRLSVYAASSLTDVFRELETLFEASHPGVDVALTFAGSQILRVQIQEGAPADVFASADPEHIRALTSLGLASRVSAFAANELVVVVPVENPAGIERFEDLPRASRIVIGSPGVPVGRYARAVLHRADEAFGPDFADSVLAKVVSEETNVRLARSRVELGEADAALVYRTDARTARNVRVILIPPTVSVRAEYAAAVVHRDAGSPLARSWVDFLLTPEAREVLSAHGFGEVETS